MLSGTRTSIEAPWRFVLDCLSTRTGSVDPAPRVKMLDTVLLDGTGGGQAENFFFTAADGTVRRKGERFLSKHIFLITGQSLKIIVCFSVNPILRQRYSFIFSLKAIEKELRSRATTLKKSASHGSGPGDSTLQTAEHVIAMARRKTGEYFPITSKMLHTIVKGGVVPADFDCIYPFKGGKDFDITAEFANYQHQYILDDIGGGVSTGTTHRRVGLEISGSKEGKGAGTGAQRHNLLLSKNARINAEVVATVRSVVIAIERSKHCRVLRLDTEFVLDGNDELWLVGVTCCTVAARPTISGAQELGDNGPQGASFLKEEERALATELRHRKHEADQIAGVLGDENFSQLLRSVGYHSPEKSRAVARRRRHRPRPIVDSTNPSSTIPRNDNDEYRARETGGDSVALSQRVLPNTGTRSQRTGTRAAVHAGMASFDWADLDPGEGSATSDFGDNDTDGGSRAASRSPSPPRSTVYFDSSVAKLDQAATNRIYGSTQVCHCVEAKSSGEHNTALALTSYWGDFCDFDVGKRVREEENRRRFAEKAARAAGALNGRVENLSTLRRKIISMESGDLGDGPSASATPAEVREGGRGPRVARHTDTTSERLDITYKAIVQARQERPLVEAFLRRYARGEDGAYHRYLDGGQGDEPYLVGGKYPGVYYRLVRVCSNCHMVYTLLDEARARALRAASRTCAGGGDRRHPVTPRLPLGQLSCDEKGAGSMPTAMMLLTRAGEKDNTDGQGHKESPIAAETVPAVSASSEGHEYSSLAVSLSKARRAMDVISQGDISELRSLVRPPATVVHVASIALLLLEGKTTEKATAVPVSWAIARTAMCRAGLLPRLRALDPRAVTPQQLSLVGPALERSSLDPAVVRPLCNAAGNLCLWILGVIQANRWLTGSGHSRTNVVPVDGDIRRWGYDHVKKHRGTAVVQRQQPFPQQKYPRRTRWASPSRAPAGRRRCRLENHAVRAAPSSNGRGGREAPNSVSLEPTSTVGFGVFGPATASPNLGGEANSGFGVSSDQDDAVGATSVAPAASLEKRLPCRRKKNLCGRVAAQAFTSGRLANAGQCEAPETSSGKHFVCSDGRTRLPYRVCGNPRTSSSIAESCNFVVVHDFFDNVDKTEVFFRPVTRKHRGCRVLAFSYPGQAGTVFRVSPSMVALASPEGNATRSNGGGAHGLGSSHRGVGSGGGSGKVRKEVPNNAFLAPRLHELLQHVHSVGEMSLTAPFHLVSLETESCSLCTQQKGVASGVSSRYALNTFHAPTSKNSTIASPASSTSYVTIDNPLKFPDNVGIGNGMATAAAFALRYGDHPLYRSSIRSVVSINGFSSVDSQLAAILHSSLNAFATLPPARPDLPVLFMSRYIFSDDYLRKVGRDLALGIYTAVANPVSLEGRHLLCNSALLHEDVSAEVGALGVPIVLLQSTEDMLVNPANVDPFLRGRSSTHHFWSHEFRDGRGGAGSDGELTSSAAAAEAARGSSVYGRKGLTDLLRALSRPRGTFVAWVRAGHEVCQEGKRAVIDLLDVLAKPTPAYTGVDEADVLQGEAEGAATLGLYPSGEWVARVNKRGGGPANAAEVATSQTGDFDDSEGDDAAMSADRGRREEKGHVDCDGIGEGGAEREGSGLPAAASPFPRDLSIPTLPASVALGHRTPNTSPIKRSHAATSGAGNAAGRGRGAHRTVGGRSGSSRRQARSVDAFGVSDDKDVEPHEGRQARGRGSGRDRGALDGRERDSGAVGGPLVSVHGCRRRPKVVWKDNTPQEAVEQVAPTTAPFLTSRAHGDKDKEGGAGEKDYSTSYFPTAAVLYDGEHSNRPTALRDREDPWDLLSNPPSLEFPLSGEHQRGNRRWVVNKPTTGGNGGQGEVSLTSPTSSSTAAATAGATSSSGHGSDSPSLADLLEAEASLEGRLCEARRRAAERLVREEADAERRIAGITREQQARGREFAEEDRQMIADLEAQLAAGRRARAPADLQRAVDGVNVDDAIVRGGLVASKSPSSPPTSSASTRGRKDNCDSVVEGEAVGGVGRAFDSSSTSPPFPFPVRAMPPLDYSPLDALPEELQRATDAYSLMDDAARDEAEMLRIRKATGGGAMSVEEFQRDQAAAAAEAAAWRLGSKKAFRKRSKSELDRARVEAALRFQPLVRGVLARKRARRLRLQRDEERELSAAATKVQAVARGHLAKEHARVARKAAVAELVLGGSAIRLQSAGRGMLGRRRAARRRRQVMAEAIQRCYRGHLGRRSAAHQRALLESLRQRNMATTRIQSWWRCKLAMDRYARDRATSIAAIEIQRCYRGMIGRKKASRRLEWEKSEPGPERLKLGVRLIEESKSAFEAQRMEIAALHTAGERAAVRTSRIRKELGASEKELTALEREMHEIDHIEGQLSQLNHQRNMVQLGLMQAGETMPGVDTPAPSRGGAGGSGGGDEGVWGGDNVRDAADKDLGFAIEMQIQVKRAEREKKRQELEADFRGVREEVDLKRRELDRVSAAITEIESTRERKTVEFRRMQANLMELLREQKLELDAVKEKGVQLEVATATSAATASATAQRARDHEERSSAMYSQTEELMKFQFMSMSLSYFSSLNMLKTMRDINADTTTAAVTSSADAAAAAAASAAAANIPAIKAGKVMESVADVTSQEIGRKNKVLREKMEAQEEMEEANAHPFPPEVRFWTKEDVGFFLTTLGLRQYRAAFEEAAVDGDFLLALDANDCADVLGVEHALHSKKLFLAIDKLRPLGADERRKKVGDAVGCRLLLLALMM
ncbi:unnamed protein product [Ectocarpus sp. CCAP 1310/34]|nr:unnamed protein product [Ectocarpus sp. CCAP 1310/34]